MKVVSVHEAKRSLIKLLSEVEDGETVLITKDGRTVAELRTRSDDTRDETARQAAYERMVELMRAWPDRSYRVGKITEDDKYGDAPVTGGSCT